MPNRFGPLDSDLLRIRIVILTTSNYRKKVAPGKGVQGGLELGGRHKNSQGEFRLELPLGLPALRVRSWVLRCARSARVR